MSATEVTTQPTDQVPGTREPLDQDVGRHQAAMQYSLWGPWGMTAVGLALVPAALLLARGCAMAQRGLAARILSPAPAHEEAIDEA